MFLGDKSATAFLGTEVSNKKNPNGLEQNCNVTTCSSLMGFFLEFLKGDLFCRLFGGDWIFFRGILLEIRVIEQSPFVNPTL